VRNRKLITRARARIRMTPRCRRLIAVLSLTMGLQCLILPLNAQTFRVLHKFEGGTDGAEPISGLVRDQGGNLYGVTVWGGEPACSFGGSGCGAVFKIDIHGNESILYRFSGKPDGAMPRGGLAIDSDGNLYGTTYNGGTIDAGTVFEVDASGHETVLYSFGSPPDGQYPLAGLTFGSDGALYGVTEEGGTSTSCWGGCGTVFRVDKTGKETVLISFEPPAEYPAADLILGTDSNMYGTTSGNGYCCLGTVFEIGRKATAAVTLHRFTGSDGGVTPEGSVARDDKGYISGVTWVGGDLNCPQGQGYGCGVLYRLRGVGKHGETVLHAFAGPPDGAKPMGGLLVDGSGSIYGTTSLGGSTDQGTIFRLDKNGTMTILHSFSGVDGALPQAGMLRDDAGNLYGTAWWGGDFQSPHCGYNRGCGVVFELSSP
jgi:uncharacterized repeat protein (TIGR03803 family)